MPAWLQHQCKLTALRTRQTFKISLPVTSWSPRLVFVFGSLSYRMEGGFKCLPQNILMTDWARAVSVQ